MPRRSTYDKVPFIPVGSAEECCVGWSRIADRLRGAAGGCPPQADGCRGRVRGRERCVVAVECYPGAFTDDIRLALMQGLEPALLYDAGCCLKTPCEVDRMLAPVLGDDPVFGRMNGLEIADFIDPAKLAAARKTLGTADRGLVLVVGTGAALVAAEPDLLVYADMARWEIQMRQRRGETGSLGGDNLREHPALKYKRAFFVDWRAADRLKKRLLPRVDFLLDTNDADVPKLVSGNAFRRGLAAAARRPFRPVPFFDPGPWGGEWMRRVCDLPDDAPNYAWGFDCVPEENSLLLGFGDVRVEVPSIDLVFQHPRELLGDATHARFGTEFPIRFDMLDTMRGGNLSLQVHPLTEYIHDRFGMHYTQDESYYLLDADPDACVYLGLKDGTDPASMFTDLRRAQREPGFRFPDEQYVNRFPARKHDHFLIPAGTVHCSGRNSMVLEISATPYIFTFKLWDWGRLGLDGGPRPIHLDHGAASVQIECTRPWVERNLINRIELVAEGCGWREERTGLHEREFIETRRHWFRDVVPHDTGGIARGGVHVLNLVEGEEVVVESPTSAFEPFVVHYAETFIVPAAVGPYTIRPHGSAEGTECGTIKAFVRSRP